MGTFIDSFYNLSRVESTQIILLLSFINISTCFFVCKPIVNRFCLNSSLANVKVFQEMSFRNELRQCFMTISISSNLSKYCWSIYLSTSPGMTLVTFHIPKTVQDTFFSNRTNHYPEYTHIPTAEQKPITISLINHHSPPGSRKVWGEAYYTMGPPFFTPTHSLYSFNNTRNTITNSCTE